VAQGALSFFRVVNDADSVTASGAIGFQDRGEANLREPLMQSVRVGDDRGLRDADASFTGDFHEGSAIIDGGKIFRCTDGTFDELRNRRTRFMRAEFFCVKGMKVVRGEIVSGDQQVGMCGADSCGERAQGREAPVGEGAVDDGGFGNGMS